MKYPWQKLTNSQVCSIIQQLPSPLESITYRTLLQLNLFRDRGDPALMVFLHVSNPFCWAMCFHSNSTPDISSIWEMCEDPLCTCITSRSWCHCYHGDIKTPEQTTENQVKLFFQERGFQLISLYHIFPLKLDPLGEIPSCRSTTQVATDTSLQAATPGNVKKNHRSTYQMQSAPVCK